MGGFEIIEYKVNSDDYGYIIINKNIESIRNKFKVIEDFLKDKKHCGDVLINNLTFCRCLDKSFSKIYFDGESFKASTWKDVDIKDLDKETISTVKDFFKRKPDLLLDPILPEIK